MLKPLLLSVSLSAFLLTSGHAMPGPLGLSGTNIEPAISLPVVKAVKKLKKLKKFGKKLNPFKKSTPSTPNAGAVPNNIAPGSVNAPSAPRAPSAPSGANAFPRQQQAPAPSWMSNTIKTNAVETRTPAAKAAMLDNLNQRNARGGMVYTENGGFRTKNGGARVNFKDDGSYSIDASDVRNRWTANEQKQIDAIARGDVSFQFRNTDNGVLRMVDREGQEVFLNYTGQFTRKTTAVTRATPLAPSGAIAPPRTPPGSPSGSLRGQNQFQNPAAFPANQPRYDSVAPLQPNQPRYDNVAPLPPVNYDRGFPANNVGAQAPANNLPGAYIQPNEPLN